MSDQSEYDRGRADEQALVRLFLARMETDIRRQQTASGLDASRQAALTDAADRLQGVSNALAQRQHNETMTGLCIELIGIERNRQLGLS